MNTHNRKSFFQIQDLQNISNIEERNRLFGIILSRQIEATFKMRPEYTNENESSLLKAPPETVIPILKNWGFMEDQDGWFHEGLEIFVSFPSQEKDPEIIRQEKEQELENRLGRREKIKQKKKEEKERKKKVVRYSRARKKYKSLKLFHDFIDSVLYWF